MRCLNLLLFFLAINSVIAGPSNGFKLQKGRCYPIGAGLPDTIEPVSLINCGFDPTDKKGFKSYGSKCFPVKFFVSSDGLTIKQLVRTGGAVSLNKCGYKSSVEYRILNGQCHKAKTLVSPSNPTLISYLERDVDLKLCGYNENNAKFKYSLTHNRCRKEKIIPEINGDGQPLTFGYLKDAPLEHCGIDLERPNSVSYYLNEDRLWNTCYEMLKFISYKGLGVYYKNQRTERSNCGKGKSILDKIKGFFGDSQKEDNGIEINDSPRNRPKEIEHDYPEQESPTPPSRTFTK